jgi:DNA repair exonuclease SbcCD ATPase subunit
MFKIKTLTARNFMSIGNATQALNFDRRDLTLVLGENLDLGGDDSGARNGTGKTTIINALSYALYGQALTNIKKDNLINKTNTKNMMVTVNFEKDGQNYKIERGRKPGVIKFWVGDVEREITDEAQGDSRETQAEIERMLGLSHDMFKHVVALNTYTEPFLAMKANDQRTLIEQLLGITLLSEKADRLKELIKSTKDAIVSEEARIRAVTDANKRIEEQIENLKRRQTMWQVQHDKSLDNLITAYNKLDEIDIETELVNHGLLTEWNAKKKKQDEYNAIVVRQSAWAKKQSDDLAVLEKKLESKSSLDIDAELKAHEDLVVYAERERKINELKTYIGRCESDEKKEQRVIDKLKAEIAVLEDYKCHACGQDLHDDSHEKMLEEKRRALQESSLQALATNTQLIEHTQALSELGELGVKPKTFYKTYAEAVKHSSDIDGIVKQIESKVGETDPYAEQLANYVPEDLGEKPVTIYKTESEAFEHRSSMGNLLTQMASKQAEIDPYVDQIREMNDNAIEEIDYSVMNDLDNLKNHQEFLLKLLTNKDSFIRKRIIDQNLSYLNARLGQYLDRIGLPHTVKFNNDLTVSITELGRDLDFDNLSRGERNRLILSLSWAFRDVWESLYQPINLLFIDELVDSGMDSSGVENSLAILKKMSRDSNKSIWLVSHKDELAGRVNNTLRVVKENGYTTYNTDVEMA